MTQHITFTDLLSIFDPSTVIRPTRWGLQEAELEAFGRVCEIVERYDELIGAANPSMFSEAEWNVLRELALGSHLCADFARHLDLEAEDGLAHDELAEKWEIDGGRFLAIVRSLSFAQRLAVVERLEAEEAERRARR